MRAAPRAASVSRSDPAAPDGVVRRAGAAALNSTEVERALATRPCARSEHFLLHCAPASGPGELSTAVTYKSEHDVDEPRLGLVVPKRHARRAVTRNLIKRQGRCAFVQHAPRLGPGHWLLRLRSPYAIERYPSAASAALKSAVRGELQALFEHAATR